MGKKNKKRDIFDMSPEEQMANAARFHEVETGEISFLEALNCKVPVGVTSQSDYKRQIEQACFGTVSDKQKSLVEEPDPIADAIQHNVISPEQPVEIESDNDIDDIPSSVNAGDLSGVIHTDHSMKSEGLHKVRIWYNSVIGKVIISDGYVDTAVSVFKISAYKIDSDMIPDDGDVYAHLCSRLFYYIITRKHPAVIMSADTFEIEFSMYAKINFNKFVFFMNEGYVYAYIVEPDDVSNFYGVTEIYNMDNTSTIAYLVGTALTANTIDNRFMFDDEDEVESVMEDRHEIKQLISLIDSDSDTEYAGHNSSGNVMDRMRVIDLEAFNENMQESINRFIKSDNYDDDDDEEYADVEDDDNADDEIDINDFPVDTDTEDDLDSIIENVYENDSDDDDTDDSDVDDDEDDDSDTFPITYRRR